MLTVHASEIPAESLLGQYVASGAYADCYVTELAQSVSHAQFVAAFYTTALFKIERFLLRLFASRPSTDAEAQQLAQGQVSSFAAWSIEARSENEILLSAGRTRSWLMVTSPPGVGSTGTQLYFGSAVLPRRSTSRSSDGLGPLFGALLGFHKLYSRALLLAAKARLYRQGARVGRRRRSDA